MSCWEFFENLGDVWNMASQKDDPIPIDEIVFTEELFFTRTYLVDNESQSTLVDKRMYNHQSDQSKFHRFDTGHLHIRRQLEWINEITN